MEGKCETLYYFLVLKFSLRVIQNNKILIKYGL